MTFIRSKDVIKSHDRAIIYVQHWWKQNKNRVLIGNVTGNQFGIDLYNDIENVHINYRTGKGKWQKGSFPYNTLRELTHKIVKYQKLKKETNKETYIAHISTDFKRLILAKVDTFDPSKTERVQMPCDNNNREFVYRNVCYSHDFEDHELPVLEFGKRERLSNFLGGTPYD